MKVLIAILSRAENLLAGVRVRLMLRTRNVRAGPGCKIASNVRFRVTDGAFLSLGEKVVIDRFADVTAKYGRLEIGSGVYIGQCSVICSREKITIGTDVQIGEHVTIRDQDHRFGFDLTTSTSGFLTAPIVIGDNVWIGAKSTITKGVYIGRNAVIGANSVVTHDVPANVLVAGVPAKIIKQIGGVDCGVK